MEKIETKNLQNIEEVPKQELNLVEKVDAIYKAFTPEVKGKTKKIKIPRKAKVRKGKAKKGYIGIIRVDENGVISGEKQKVEDSCFTLKRGTYHATNGTEILMWEGKYPVIIQETKKLNPVKFNEGKNETYGQKYTLAKMLKDTIKTKMKGGGFIIWIVLAVAVFIGYNLIKGGS